MVPALLLCLLYSLDLTAAAAARGFFGGGGGVSGRARGNVTKSARGRRGGDRLDSLPCGTYRWGRVRNLLGQTVFFSKVAFFLQLGYMSKYIAACKQCHTPSHTVSRMIFFSYIEKIERGEKKISLFYETTTS